MNQRPQDGNRTNQPDGAPHPGAGAPGGWSGRIGGRRALIGAGILLAGVIAGRCSVSQRTAVSDGGEGAAEEKKVAYWTCSMHPQVKLDRAGTCPICEMPLIPAGQSSSTSAGVPTLSLSEHAIAMASVETVPVVRRELSHEIRAVGKIQYNESALATITARVNGYAERLFVNFTGVDIKAGDHLAEVYSPDLVIAQQELLIAARSGASGLALESSRLKLRRWGLTDQQIDEVIKSNHMTDRITLYSPIDGTVIEKSIVENSAFEAGDALYRIANLDTVWVYLDIYEYDLAWVRYGQQVRITAEAYPARVFDGMVSFVQPILNEATRTILVPVHIENREHLLKPGMFVSAVVHATLGPDGRAAPTGVEGRYTCPMHPQVLLDGPGSCPICEMPLEQIPAAGDPHHQIPASQAASDKSGFICPMKCEGEKYYQEPGRCPVCEMKLGAAAVTEEPASTYGCPMKCEGEKTYAQPGRCPECNMKLEEIRPTSQPAGPGVLSVPITAVLDSGTRRIVYVEKGGATFEPREVVVGARSGDYYPILSGLNEGDRVVARGGFLIDSQFQITGHSSLFYPGGLHASTGHQHGAEEGAAATQPAGMDAHTQDHGH